MKKFFPMMLHEPDAPSIGTGVAYGLFAFFLIPALYAFVAGSALGMTDEVWFEIGYHVLNFVVLLITFLRYLRESFFEVQLRPKKVFATAAACAAVIVVLKLLVLLLSVLTQNGLFVEVSFGSWLTTEADLLYYSTAVIAEQPLWGTLCLVLLAPFTVSLILYASVFGPVCVHRPWLAYLLMAVVTLVVHLSLVFCLWPLPQHLALFLIQLPVHLIACWAYQKTDTIWTPIFLLILQNLVMALLTLLLMAML